MYKIIGHLSPDTDSTCAPIVYAWYLRHKDMDVKPFITGDLNREAAYVLEHFGVAKPELLESLSKEDKYFLVDTNNPEELVSGYDKAELMGIVDHHKLVGGLNTESPIHITIRPVACTMTVIWELMERDGITDIPQDVAGLMLAAILSDTLKFTSPTTTNIDKEIAEKLADIAREDMDKLAEEMFAAKSNLEGMSAKDILLSDSKKFDLNDKKLRVSVLETTKPENSLSLKEGLLDAMQEIKEEEKLDGFFFFIVDILNTESHLIVPGEFEVELAQKAFEGRFADKAMRLPGVVSRKKQMIPNIQKTLS